MTDTKTVPASVPEIRKGLAGVVVDTTAISKVNPETNSLLYRGYPVQQLAATKRFEEVAYLLWHGELPDAAQLAEFRAAERAGRALQPNVKAAIDLLPTTAHPMDVVRTAVSVIGASDPTTDDASHEANLAKSMSLFAALPAIVRRINVSGAFAVRDVAVPAAVAIVDDVLTTGSTADALARAPKRAGWQSTCSAG